jgi:hypothetical protein
LRETQRIISRNIATVNTAHVGAINILKGVGVMPERIFWTILAIVFILENTYFLVKAIDILKPKFQGIVNRRIQPQVEVYKKNYKKRKPSIMKGITNFLTRLYSRRE